MQFFAQANNILIKIYEIHYYIEKNVMKINSCPCHITRDNGIINRYYISEIL